MGGGPLSLRLGSHPLPRLTEQGAHVAFAPTCLKVRRIPPRRQEANRSRKEAEEGPLSQAKRHWPGAALPGAEVALPGHGEQAPGPTEGLYMPPGQGGHAAASTVAL